MYRVPPARAWWPAVGAPLEPWVRPQLQLFGLECIDGKTADALSPAIDFSFLSNFKYLVWCALQPLALKFRIVRA